jgi:hypothetical protein
LNFPATIRNVCIFRTLAEKCESWQQCHNLRARESNKQQKKKLVTSMGWLRPPEFLEFPPRGELKETRLAHRRDVLREDTPWNGAGAVPPRGLVTRAGAASGISLPAL